VLPGSEFVYMQTGLHEVPSHTPVPFRSVWLAVLMAS
jgi:hypothetical protein